MKPSLTKWLSARLRNKWLWVRIPLLSFKLLILFLEIFMHDSFRERLLFDAQEGINFSFDNPLDSHSVIVPVRPENVVIIL